MIRLFFVVTFVYKMMCFERFKQNNDSRFKIFFKKKFLSLRCFVNIDPTIVEYRSFLFDWVFNTPAKLFYIALVDGNVHIVNIFGTMVEFGQDKLAEFIQNNFCGDDDAEINLDKSANFFCHQLEAIKELWPFKDKQNLLDLKSVIHFDGDEIVDFYQHMTNKFKCVITSSADTMFEFEKTGNHNYLDYIISIFMRNQILLAELKLKSDILLITPHKYIDNYVTDGQVLILLGSILKIYCFKNGKNMLFEKETRQKFANLEFFGDSTFEI